MTEKDMKCMRLNVAYDCKKWKAHIEEINSTVAEIVQVAEKHRMTGERRKERKKMSAKRSNWSGPAVVG